MPRRRNHCGTILEIIIKIQAVVVKEVARNLQYKPWPGPAEEGKPQIEGGGALRYYVQEELDGLCQIPTSSLTANTFRSCTSCVAQGKYGAT